MMSGKFDPLKRPPTPPKTAWFEFLLSPSLLEEHLQNKDAEPSASELIALFLYQAELAAITAKEIAKSSEENTENSVAKESRKVKALKTLALKVASLLNWSLATLEDGLPLATVENILVELLSVALPGVEPIAKRHASLDLTSLTPTAVFAVVWFHRWSLHTAIQDTFPVKPSKVPHVQVPGLLDPSIQSSIKKESILHNVKDGLCDSVDVLEQYMKKVPSITAPTCQCFKIISEKADEGLHDFSLAVAIPAGEVKAQISYELGMLYFHRQEYEKACDLFMQTRNQINEVTSSLWCELDRQRLEGYCCACNGMLGRPLPKPVSEEALLVDSIESIRTDNFEGLTSSLMQDNQKCVLSLAYRESLEEDLISTNTSKHLIMEVRTCNMIRKALDGILTPSAYIHMLCENPDHVDFLLDMATGVLRTASVKQKENLKYFISFLSNVLPKTVKFTEHMLNSDLKVLFSAAEMQMMRERWKESTSVAPMPPRNVYPNSGEESVQLGELEHELLVTYDPNVIKSLVQKLLPKVGKYQLIFLTEKWHLPKELQHGIETLPVPPSYYSIYIHILVAKARVATEQQMFRQAQELLQAADSSIKDLSYKLSKMLRWEILKVDLLYYNDAATLSGGLNADLIKRCRMCINSAHSEADLQSLGEVIALVTQFLLNQRQWDFLANVAQNQTGYIQLAKQVANLCKELPQSKHARKFARELWESVTLIFTNSNSHKRSASGTAINVNRDGNLGIVPQQLFTKFFMQCKEPMLLSILLSLLAKLYNVLKDDLTVEITSDYLTLWPTTLANSSSINLPAVTDTVMALMETALKQQPMNPSWLRTQADIHYANSQYRQAVKYYLQLGIVLSDYFTKPITKNIYDENIYRRLIRCCNYLQCHSQVVVLCQFFDEPDYATAFKAIQEKTCHDAMDMYYNYIWDITLLEYLVYHHNKRGEFDKKQTVMKLVGQMELNSSNPPAIIAEAAKQRKTKFLQAMAKEYLQGNDIVQPLEQC